jgi:hypothetical protein
MCVYRDADRCGKRLSRLWGFDRYAKTTRSVAFSGSVFGGDGQDRSMEAFVRRDRALLSEKLGPDGLRSGKHPVKLSITHKLPEPRAELITQFLNR